MKLKLTKSCNTWLAAAASLAFLSCSPFARADEPKGDKDKPMAMACCEDCSCPECAMKQRMQSKADLQSLHERLKDLKNAGKKEEAEKVRDKITALEAKVQKKDTKPSADKMAAMMKKMEAKMRQEKPQMKEREPFRPMGAFEGPGARERLEHLEVAIENLHAAGLHEPAERLEQLAEGMRQRLEGDAGPGAGLGFMPPPELQQHFEELQRQIMELHQQMRELQERLEQMNRERR